MQEQDKAFEGRQELCAVGVHECSDGGDRDGEEGSVPAVEVVYVAGVARVVEDEETLDQGSAEEADTSKSCLPS